MICISRGKKDDIFTVYQIQTSCSAASILLKAITTEEINHKAQILPSKSFYNNESVDKLKSIQKKIRSNLMDWRYYLIAVKVYNNAYDSDIFIIVCSIGWRGNQALSWKSKQIKTIYFLQGIKTQTALPVTLVMLFSVLVVFFNQPIFHLLCKLRTYTSLIHSTIMTKYRKFSIEHAINPVGFFPLHVVITSPNFEVLWVWIRLSQTGI